MSRIKGRHCRRFPSSAMLVAAIVIGTVAVAGAAEADPIAANRIPLLDLLRQGGWTMVPLAGCSLAVLALGGYVYWESGRGRILSDSLALRGDQLMKPGGDVPWRQWLAHDPSLLGQALAQLEVAPGDGSGWSEELHRVIRVEEMRLVQWVTYLNVAAALAPMIGLLGTVSGMIGAFQTISAGGMGRPELLAGDIGQALVTTATGLSIGIPAMVAFFYLRNRLELRFEEAREWVNAQSHS